MTTAHPSLTPDEIERLKAPARREKLHRILSYFSPLLLLLLWNWRRRRR